MEDKAGFVYVAVNDSLSDFVKIGETSRDVRARMKELSGTGVPGEWKSFFYMRVEDRQAFERWLHDYFEDDRDSNNREFFRVAPTEVKRAMKMCKEPSAKKAANSHSVKSTQTVPAVRPPSDEVQQTSPKEQIAAPVSSLVVEKKVESSFPKEYFSNEDCLLPDASSFPANEIRKRTKPYGHTIKRTAKDEILSRAIADLLKKFPPNEVTATKVCDYLRSKNYIIRQQTPHHFATHAAISTMMIPIDGRSYNRTSTPKWQAFCDEHEIENPWRRI